MLAGATNPGGREVHRTQAPSAGEEAMAFGSYRMHRSL